MRFAKIRFLSPCYVIPLNTLLACAKIMTSGRVAKVAKGYLPRTDYMNYCNESFLILTLLVFDGVVIVSNWRVYNACNENA